MPIFIVKNNPNFLKPIVLEKEDEHHLLRVFRAKVLDTVDIVDNGGHCVQAEISKLKPLEFKILEKRSCPPPFPITVCLPLIGQTRLEWVVEKLCELNVATVQLITTDRTQLTDLSEKKMNRLHKIALAAQKQCERAWPLEILDVVALKDYFFNESGQYFVGQLALTTDKPRTDTDLNEPVTNHLSPITIFIGPEGGWTSQELDFFIKNKVRFMSIGSNVLRTETAAIALVLKIIVFPHDNSTSP